MSKPTSEAGEMSKMNKTARSSSTTSTKEQMKQAERTRTRARRRGGNMLLISKYKIANQSLRLKAAGVHGLRPRPQPLPE